MREEPTQIHQKNTGIPAIEKAPQREYYPVSKQQEGVWLQAKIDPASTVWNTSHSWRYEGRLDTAAMKEALRQLIRRHKPLRTNFRLEGDRICQFIHERYSIEAYYRYIDISGKPGEEREAEARRLEIEVAQEPYDLEKTPLARYTVIRLREDEHVLVMGLHHIITDVTTRQILWKELIALYNAEALKKPVELEPIEIQYHDYAEWQQKFFKTPYYERQREYWQARLTGPLPVLNLPLDYPRQEKEAGPAKIYRYTVELERELAEKLRTFSLRNRVAFSVVFLSSLYILLYKSCGQSDIIIGSLYRGRDIDKNALNKMVGLFANFTALRLNLNEDTPVKGLLKEVDKITREALENQDFRYEDLVRTLHPDRDPLHAPVFQVVFNMIKLAGMNIDPEGLTRIQWEPYKPDNEISSRYDFSLYVRDELKKITLRVLYTKDRYTVETIKMMLDRYIDILVGMCEAPGEMLRDFQVITAKERERILNEFNATGAEYPREKTIPQLFTEQEKRTSRHVAIIDPGIEGASALGKTNLHVTYGELKQKSRKLASFLKGKGVRPDTIVGIMVERSIEMITGIFGIMMAGGAYMPVDPGYPGERIDYMLKDSNSLLLLTATALEEALNRSDMSDTTGDIHQPPVTSLAYVIYTSGTTGKPKGVMINHRSSVNYLWWATQNYIKKESVNFPLFTSISFDLTVTSIFTPLITGNAVVVYRQQREMENIIERIIEDNRVGVIKLTPSHLRLLQPKKSKNKSLTFAIKRFILGGEQLETQLVKDIIDYFHGEIEIYNEYGPTEATVGCMIYRCDIEKDHGLSTPIGKPAANSRIFVLDQNQKLLPQGIPGEIYISGDGLARGYLNRPELTNEKFLRGAGAVFSKRAPAFYKTGDLARWLPDGNIEYLGRMDDQVKIRGNRIELGEIEAMLNGHPFVKKVAAAAIMDEEGRTSLCAYVVPDGQSEPDPLELREFLNSKLPEYMVPTYFVRLEKLPLAPSGKIDRKALPKPGTREGMIARQCYEAPHPGNDLQQILVSVWQEVLGLKKIGITDNFFTIGGDSIIAIRIASQLRVYGYQLGIDILFKYPTIKLLANHMGKIYGEIDQEPVSGTVPLIPIQAWFIQRNFAYKHHWNLAFMVYRQEEFEARILKDVFKRILEHHDLLRAVLSRNEPELIEKRPSELEVPLEVMDLRTVDEENLETCILENANRIQAGIDLYNGPLIKTALFKTQEADHLLIVIHHLVVDGISWRILFEDISLGYEQARQRKTIQLPPKTHSYKRWAEEIKAYSRSPRLRQEYDYWKAICTTNNTGLSPQTPGAIGKLKDYYRYQIELGEEESRLLLNEVNRAYHTEINDILLSALSLVFQDCFGLNKIYVSLEGHGREKIADNIDISRTIGWFTTQYPILLEVNGSSDSLGMHIQHTKENLRKIPGKGIGFGILRYISPLPENDRQLLAVDPEISFNYLGQFDEDLSRSRFKRSPYPTGNTRSQESEQPYNVNINGMIINRKLTFTFNCNSNTYDYRKVETLAQRYKQRLQEIIAHCRQREEPVYSPSDYGARGLDFQDLEAIRRQFGKTNTAKIYNMSPMQEGMLYHYLSDQRRQAYQVQVEYLLQGEIDAGIFIESFERLLAKYEVFRTAFAYQNIKKPYQVVLKQRQSEVYRNDFTEGKEDPESAVEEIKKQDRERGFDLQKDTLLRYTLVKTHPGKYTLLVTFHHMIMDGWSTNLMMKDWVTLYGYLKNGTVWEPQERYSYSEYTQWLKEQDREAAANFWRGYLSGYEQVTMIPSDKAIAGPGNEGNKRQRYIVEIEKETIEGLTYWSREWNVTLNNIIQAVWGVILQRYTGGDDIVFGNVISGRNIPMEGIDRVIGLFINTIPMRVILERHRTFAEVARKIKENLLEIQQYGYLPLGEIQGYAEAGGPVLQHLYIYENYPVDREIRSAEQEKKIGFKIVGRNSEEHTEYPLDIMIIPREEFRICIQYNENVYTPSLVTRLVGHIKRLIGEVLREPGQRLKELEIITPGEKQQILEEFNRTGVENPGGRTIHRIFEEQVERTPGHISLVGVGLVGAVRPVRQVRPVRPTQPVQLTYRELNERSGRLATRLKEKGVRPETIVGIMMERSVEMVEGIMGILKAGGAYMPIDPGYPEERVNYMLADSGAKLLVSDRNDVGTGHCPVLILDLVHAVHGEIGIQTMGTGNSSTGTGQCPVPTDSLGYVIYTSGSTGRPKGVMVSHGAVVNTLTALQERYPLRETDAYLLKTSYVFDVSVAELYGWYMDRGGGRMVVLEQGGEKDPGKIIETVQRERVTHLNFVPSMFKVFIEVLNFQNIKKLSCLKYIFLAGEALMPQMVERFRALNKQVELENLYGPTEAAVYAGWYSLSQWGGGESIPIGRPLFNVKLYILDKVGQLQVVGVPGELSIAGAGLARGYLNRPELTREKFYLRRPGGSFCKNRPLDPCKNFLLNHSTTHHSPLTIYKTGDLARWQSDGNIEFLGRIDHQVKIRGYRIEMGEIEAQLQRHNKIKNSVVTVVTDPEGGKSICAYVVGEEALTVPQVREYLEKRLPAYMVPAYIMRLEQIPVTVSGKIDRKALPGPGKTGTGEAGYEPPEPGNDVQQKLVSVMQEVLRVDKIGLKDNFFALGGDSIKAIQVVSRLGVYGYRLDINAIFKKPVVKELWKEVGRVVGEIEQQAVTGIIPLTPIQAWYKEQDFTQKQHWNMAVMVTRPGGYRPELLQRVFTRIMEHHDLLRAVLSPDERTMEIKRPGEIQAPVEVINLEKMEKGSRELEDRVREEAGRIQAGIDLKRGPLIKVALFRTPGGDHLLIVIHHLVVDGISWRILLEDISRGYEQAGQGREIRYPAKTHSYKRWSEELAAYGQTPRLMKEYGYWREICTASAPLLPDPGGTGGREEVKTKLKDYIQSTLEMGEEETRWLLTDVHRAYHTEINDILLSALGLAVEESFGVKKVMIHLEGHGREKITRDLDISRTVGWYTGLYPVVLEVDEKEPGPVDEGEENHPLARQIRRCKETLRKIPRKGIGYGILRYLSPLPEPDRQAMEVRPGILFNYLGQFDEDLKAAGYEKSTYSTGRSRSPESEGTHAININGQVEGGKLILTIRGDGRRVEAGQLRTLAHSYKNNLQKIIAHCREVAEPGYTPSDYDAPGLDFEELAAIYRDFGKRNTGKIYNLSPMQEGMLYHYLLDPRHQDYQVQLVYMLEGEIDPARFRESCRSVVKHHDVLRTAVLYKNVKRPRQVVLKERETTFVYHEIEGAADQAAWWEDYKKRDRQKGFEIIDEPLIRWALIKTHQDRYTLLITFHHLVLDGWSTNILMKETIAEYQRIKNSRPGEEEPPGEEKPYLDYIKWLEEQEKGEAHRYWQEKLRGFDQVTRLPASRQVQPGEKEKPVTREYTTVVARDIYRRLEGMARQGNVTMNIVLQAVWSVIVHRYTGAGDILFGNVISGRNISIEGIDRIMGLFINTLPMRVQIEERQTFRRMAEGLQENLMEGQRHGYLSLGEIQGYAAVDGPLLEHLYIYENYPVEQEMRSHRLAETAGFKITKRYSLENTGYPLNLMIIPREDLHLVIQYQEGVYEPGMVMGLAGHIGCAMEQVVLDPDQPVGQIEILTGEEKHRLMEEFNKTEAAYPRESTIHRLFEEQVERTPDRVALVGPKCGALRADVDAFGDKADPDDNAVRPVQPAQPVQLTYRELNERTGRLAHQLKEKGVRPDTIVGIMMERSIEMIIGIFGILRAGGAYMPIDPDYPGERIDYMLRDSKPIEFLTAGAVEDAINRSNTSSRSYISPGDTPASQPPNFPLLPATGHRPPATAISPSTLTSTSTCQVIPANLAYVIYTSGTTGKPKGVLISHGNVVRLMFNDQFQFDFNEKDVWTLFHSFCFDFSVWEMYGALLYGGKLVIIPRMVAMDAEGFLEILKKEQVTVLNQTPSAFYNLTNLELMKSGKELKTRYVIFGGEALSPGRLKKWRDAYPAAKLVNMYGITETTVHVTYKEITPIDIESGTSNIGKPIPTLCIYLIDRYLTLVPQGVAGELYVGGDGVARGYLNRPELTSERFYRPAARGAYKSNILYRTGDLARWLSNGDLEYLGRIDHQVKIRGYRIELGEIESQLHRYPGIKEAIAAVAVDESGGQNLCAYIVSGLTLTSTQLREYLSGHLPGYMIPAYFVKIDKIPLTTSGKVDRKSLPGPEKRLEVKTEYMPPRDEVEKQLVEIWQELLKIPRVGITDNFIEIGGHSLLVMKMALQIESRFGIEITLGDIFNRPTIAQIAQHINSREEKMRKLDRVLAEIEAMSEDQVRELLHNSIGHIAK